MENLTHSTGPWEVTENSRGMFCISSVEGTDIAEVVSSVTASLKDYANMGVLAAAPALLAACQNALAAIENDRPIDYRELRASVAAAIGPLPEERA